MAEDVDVDVGMCECTVVSVKRARVKVGTAKRSSESAATRKVQREREKERDGHDRVSCGMDCVADWDWCCIFGAGKEDESRYESEQSVRREWEGDCQCPHRAPQGYHRRRDRSETGKVNEDTNSHVPGWCYRCDL